MFRLLASVLLLFVLAGCSMRYGHIPRMHLTLSQQQEKGARHTGSNLRSDPNISRTLAVPKDSIEELPAMTQPLHGTPATPVVEEVCNARARKIRQIETRIMHADPLPVDSIATDNSKHNTQRITAGTLFVLAALVNVLALFTGEVGMLFLFTMFFLFLIAAIFMGRDLMEGIRFDLSLNRTQRQRRLRKIAGMLIVLSTTFYGLMIIGFLVGAELFAFVLSIPAFLMLVLGLIVFLSSLVKSEEW
ncbi:MAG: hypothetical protein H6606_01140 [Flavobacteriales bacterium]|nr:hypothetical protein [Flavobacteriales bacterium]